MTSDAVLSIRSVSKTFGPRRALDGVSLEKKGQEIFDHMLAVASGKKSKSEELGYGDNEFVPWQVGAVM